MYIHIYKPKRKNIFKIFRPDAFFSYLYKTLLRVFFYIVGYKIQ